MDINRRGFLTLFGATALTALMPKEVAVATSVVEKAQNFSHGLYLRNQGKVYPLGSIAKMTLRNEHLDVFYPTLLADEAILAKIRGRQRRFLQPTMLMSMDNCRNLHHMLDNMYTNDAHYCDVIAIFASSNNESVPSHFIYNDGVIAVNQTDNLIIIGARKALVQGVGSITLESYNELLECSMDIEIDNPMLTCLDVANTYQIDNHNVDKLLLPNYA